MPSVSEIPWIKPARTLQSIEAGASAGARVAQMRQSAQESATRLAAQQQEQAASIVAQQQEQAASIAAEQQRTQDQMAQAKMELDARQQVQQQESLKAEQQLQIDNARKQVESGLRQQQLQQVGELAQQKAREAALDFADHAAFSQEVQNGEAPEKAIWKHPRVLKSSGTMNEAIRANIPKLDPTGIETVTKTMTVPEVAEQKAVPADITPAYDSFWGTHHDAVTNKPAIPFRAGSPEYKVATSSKMRKGESGQPAAPSGNQPTDGDIERLKARPQNAAKFDKRFGAGAAAKILGGGSSGTADSDPAPNEQD